MNSSPINSTLLFFFCAVLSGLAVDKISERRSFDKLEIDR